MASTSAYDENLLSQAPEVTKADLQDGYNADLLREPTVKRAAPKRATPPLRSNSDIPQSHYHQHDKDVESSAATPLQPKENVVEYSQPRKPWWRTVKGIAVIVVLVVIIILAAVLGGVLGSRKSKPSSDAPAGPNTAGNPGDGQQSASPAASGSPSPSTTSPPASTSTGGGPQPGTPANGNGNGVGGSQGGGTTGNPIVQPTGGNGGGDADAAAPVEGGGNSGGLGSGRSPRSDGLPVELMLRDLGVRL
ncbi:hypothetical protein D9756_007830 [Leucocoprinus leucothites]|uniref:Uncharacterized protein n=1 Tax=Leucocoprinus leucothites TaxID=201217 RepID=A0A8H5D4U6_9AGAR|nr:hypothetical protein D9756_007830 [Leucoagaricus leucothites]